MITVNTASGKIVLNDDYTIAATEELANEIKDKMIESDEGSKEVNIKTIP